MRLKSFIIVLLLKIHSFAIAQNIQLSAENNWLKNCNCTESSMGSGNRRIVYLKDTLNKIITSKYKIMSRWYVDTLHYDDNHNITENKRYTLYEDSSHLENHSYYRYSKEGQLLTADEGFYVYTYQYDDKGRPISYVQKHLDEQEVIKIKYTNDTTALLEYYDNGTMIAKGKRILNRRYQIVKETLQNPSKGTEVRYVFNYDKKGNLLYMQKVKVINDEVRFFGSPHYENLFNDFRKIEYSYDSSGRMITQTLYRGLDLEKLFTLEYTYK